MYNPKAAMNRGLKKQEKIGSAAAKIFDKKGYLETNIDDIAAAAKLSKGGIYHYFSSKDEILFFILDSYMDVVLKDLEPQLRTLRDSASKVKFIIERHIDLHSNNMAQAKTLLHEAHCLSPKRFKAIKVKEREYYRIVLNVLTEFFKGSEDIRKEELKAMAFFLFGMCNWTSHWYNPKGSINPEELSKFIWTVFLKGITERRKKGK